jgi:hypothetical protein
LKEKEGHCMKNSRRRTNETNIPKCGIGADGPYSTLHNAKKAIKNIKWIYDKMETPKVKNLTQEAIDKIMSELEIHRLINKGLVDFCKKHNIKEPLLEHLDKRLSERINLLKTLDTDLPEGNRTQANFWKARCMVYIQAISGANKGIRRLRRKLDKYKEENNERR